MTYGKSSFGQITALLLLASPLAAQVPMGTGGQGVIQRNDQVSLLAGADTFQVLNIDGKALLFRVDGRDLGAIEADSIVRPVGRCDPPVAEFGDLKVVYVFRSPQGDIAFGVNYKYLGCTHRP